MINLILIYAAISVCQMVRVIYLVNDERCDSAVLCFDFVPFLGLVQGVGEVRLPCSSCWSWNSENKYTFNFVIKYKYLLFLIEYPCNIVVYAYCNFKST